MSPRKKSPTTTTTLAPEIENFEPDHEIKEVAFVEEDVSLDTVIDHGTTTMHYSTTTEKPTTTRPPSPKFRLVMFNASGRLNPNLTSSVMFEARKKYQDIIFCMQPMKWYTLDEIVDIHTLRVVLNKHIKERSRQDLSSSLHELSSYGILELGFGA